MNKIFAWITGIIVILCGLLGIQTKRMKNEKMKAKEIGEQISVKDKMFKQQIEVFKKHETLVESVVKKQHEVDRNKDRIDEEIKDASKHDKAEAIENQINIGNDIAADWNNQHRLPDYTSKY